MVTRAIDLDGICDHCACGSPAAIIQDAGRFRVQCTGCGDDTDYYVTPAKKTSPFRARMNWRTLFYTDRHAVRREDIERMAAEWEPWEGKNDE